MKQLEQEIAELKRRDAKMEELSHTEDPIYFLQNFRSVSAPLGCADIPAVTVNSHHTFEDVIKSVSQVREKLEKHCKDEIDKTSSELKKIRLIPPQNREEFLDYYCQFTLDPKAAGSSLHLSDGNTVVTLSYYSPLDGLPVLCRKR
ncbi:hypothetical protein AMELA_G00058990 [Ameiurus melas]|uniref:TRIM8/14/16/25/29/45/65 coiled-coil region domain-containing protein n=1 Tax=Ameiurus melas TaxID=219545 RepID=A0A7J6B1D9_AMEME|nr:hypothetical protein AMELA_G00058990 [Ameiurus melas]